MITRALYTNVWTNAQIRAALDTLAGAGQGIQFAYFYADRVVFTARRLRDTRGVLSRVSVDELILKDYAHVIDRVHTEIHNMLAYAVQEMEKEMPAGV